MARTLVQQFHVCITTKSLTLNLILGKTYLVTQVVLYNRNDCCKERLEGVYIYLGDVPSYNGTYADNAQVAQGIIVPGNEPKVVKH